MNSAALLLFAGVPLATIATPGPTVLLALSNGSHHGVRTAAAGVAGALLSDVMLIAATALGLGAVLAASPTAFAVLKAIGVAYLAWLGIGLLRSSMLAPVAAQHSDTPAPVDAPSAVHAALFQRSLLVALASPKGLLFFSALLPQFIDPAAPQVVQYVALGLVFVAIDGAVTLGYAFAGARCLRGAGRRGTTIVNRACGAVMLALAGGLAIATR